MSEANKRSIVLDDAPASNEDMNPTGFARALSASLCWGIGVGELARRMTIEETTAEAIRLADMHRCPAYVYRLANGNLKASTNEPEVMPGADCIGRFE